MSNLDKLWVILEHENGIRLDDALKRAGLTGDQFEKGAEFHDEIIPLLKRWNTAPRFGKPWWQDKKKFNIFIQSDDFKHLYLLRKCKDEIIDSIFKDKTKAFGQLPWEEFYAMRRRNDVVRT